MKMHCGSMSDVHPYHRIQRPGRRTHVGSSPHHPLDQAPTIQLGQPPQPHHQRKKPQSPTSNEFPSPSSAVSAKNGTKQDGLAVDDAMASSSSSSSSSSLGSLPPPQDNVGSFSHIAVASSHNHHHRHRPHPLHSSRIHGVLPQEIPFRKVGLVDILMGYHSLLQATPASSILASRRKEVYPTIGFSQAHRSSGS